MLSPITAMLARRTGRPAPRVQPIPPAGADQPVTGSTPTTSDLAAARQRLALAPNPDRWTLHRVAQLVDQAAAAHADCVIVGCPVCLPLTDARAAIQAWQEATR